MPEVAPFGWIEAVAATAAFILLTMGILAWDRLGLLQGGPLPYGNRTGCDVWHYFGLSLFPQAGAFLAPETRFIGRPMYFGVIFALKSVFPSVGINLISYFAFLNLTLSAFYIALRAMFARRTAAIACILLGLSPLLLNMSSITYVTVASLAYTCCMLAGILWAARLFPDDRRRSLALYVLAGAFFLWSANANLMSIKFNFLFCLFALCGVLPIRPGLWQVATDLLCAASMFVLGMMCGAVVVVLVSIELGLGAWAPYLQVRAAIEGMGDYQYAGWLRETVAFGLIGLASFLCVAALWQTRRDTGHRATKIRVLAGIVLATGVFNLHSAFAIGDQNLAYDWFYFLLLPSVMLAFCAAFDRVIAESTPRTMAAMFVALLGAIVALNGLVASSLDIKRWMFYNTQTTVNVALAILVCVVLVGRLRNPIAIIGAVLGVSITLQTATGSQMRHHFFAERHEEAAYTRVTEDALLYIARYVDEKPVVWLASNDDWHWMQIMRGLVRCSYKPSFPEELPDPRINEQPPLDAGRTVIVIDGKGRSPAQIEEALQPRGYRLDISGTRYFELDRQRGVQVTIGKARNL